MASCVLLTSYLFIVVRKMIDCIYFECTIMSPTSCYISPFHWSKRKQLLSVFCDFKVTALTWSMQNKTFRLKTWLVAYRDSMSIWKSAMRMMWIGHCFQRNAVKYCSMANTLSPPKEMQFTIGVPVELSLCPLVPIVSLVPMDR